MFCPFLLFSLFFIFYNFIYRTVLVLVLALALALVYMCVCRVLDQDLCSFLGGVYIQFLFIYKKCYLLF